MKIIARDGDFFYVVSDDGGGSDNALTVVRIVNLDMGLVSRPLFLGSVVKYVVDLEPCEHDPEVWDRDVRPLLDRHGVSGTVGPMPGRDNYRKS